MMHTVESIKSLYASGGTLSDSEFRTLYHQNKDAWAYAVALDGEYRSGAKTPAAREVAAPSAGETTMPQKTIDPSRLRDAILPVFKRLYAAERKAAAAKSEYFDISIAIQRLTAVMLAPVIPVRDDKGRIVGAKRDVPEDKSPLATAIEERVSELEQKAATYAGTWKADQEYSAGMIVTHSGTIWHATNANKAVRPGDGACWKLMVKNR